MSRFLIVTFSDAGAAEYAAVTEEINRAYATRHGYRFLAEHSRKLGDDWAVHWEKVRMLDEALRSPSNEVVVWVDADAAVNLHDIKLESFLTGKDIVVSHDGANKKEELGVEERRKPWFANTGVLIVVNTAWSRAFVAEWLRTPGEFKKNGKLEDQDRFVQMLEQRWGGEDGAAKHVSVLPPTALNSIFGRDRPDTFVWHLMKTDNEKRARTFQVLLDRVKEGGARWPAPASPEDAVRLAYEGRFQADEARPGRVLIVMMYDDGITEYAAIAERVNRLYAARHGYDLMCVRHRLSDRDAQWDKVLAVGLAMRLLAQRARYDWFFWIDADAVFAQHDAPLHPILEEGGELVISDDGPNRQGEQSGPDAVFTNTGTFGVKNTPWAMEFMRKWWDNPMGKERELYHEQEVLNGLWKKDLMGLRSKLKLHRYDRLNSAYSELPGVARAPAQTFVLHLMRMPTSVRVREIGAVEKRVTESGGTAVALHAVDYPQGHDYSAKRVPVGAWIWVVALVLALLGSLVAYFLVKRKK